MVEVATQTKLIIGIISITVFYFLIKKIIENISSANVDSDTVINLDKISKKNRKKIDHKEQLF
tara:strand:- start:1678 stop:1866 length:189 start_codon:yes stop_codon:yes gene_type:complete